MKDALSEYRIYLYIGNKAKLIRKIFLTNYNMFTYNNRVYEIGLGGENKMWKYEHMIETEASAEAIWSLYSDVSTWTKWDTGIEDVELSGSFCDGSFGSITPRGQRALIFKLVEVREKECFTDETEIPGAGVTIRFTHRLQTLENGKTRVIHQVMMIGPAADKLGHQIGPEITSEIPKTMQALATVALHM